MELCSTALAPRNCLDDRPSSARPKVSLIKPTVNSSPGAFMIVTVVSCGGGPIIVAVACASPGLVKAMRIGVLSIVRAMYAST